MPKSRSKEEWRAPKPVEEEEGWGAAGLASVGAPMLLSPVSVVAGVAAEPAGALEAESEGVEAVGEAASGEAEKF